MKKISAIIICLFSLFFVACGNSSSADQNNVDGNQKFIEVASKAINGRWDEQEKKEKSASYSQEDYIAIIEKENEKLEGALQEVDNQELLKAGKDYIEGNNMMVEANKTTDDTLMYEYIEKSESLRKPALIKMVDDFGLVIEEKNEQIYKDFKAKATVINKENEAKKFAENLGTNIKFEVSKEYDWSKCVAVLENTSEFDFQDLAYTVQFKDKDGVVIDTGYLNLSNFSKGSKQKVETSTDEDYSTISVELEYFNLKN